ncbi:hypothetical protein [Candidatus Symbiopectobacterium sp.]|uniref:hypothetical protein n=1 Tax=Candidatus Symbiopectobacterium sp. TaxID=2816440 RepID=UPI0025C55DC6|nr:hypothetical protein [Candidatus Symbiopectobacterium sp.]
MAKVAIRVTVVSHANTDGYRAYNDELALLNKSELVTTAPHTGRLLRDANTVRHS